MSLPSITVAVTTFNRPELLKEALSSISAQTLREFDVLICDNASDERTTEVLCEFRRVFHSFRHVRHAQNIGAFENLRCALTLPRTRYVAWLSDDDLWQADHIETGVKALEDNPDAVIYGCAVEQFGCKSRGLLRPHFLEDATGLSKWDSTVDFRPLLVHTPLCGSSVIVRRRAIDDSMLWTPIPAIDWLVWGQVALRGTLLYNSEPLVRYRWHAGNASNTVLTGRRSNAQIRYVIRTLAELALERGALSPGGLEEYLIRLPTSRATPIVLALATPDTHAALRDSVKRVIACRRELTTGLGHSRALVAAKRLGNSAVSYIDLLDRLLGRWRPPAKRIRGLGEQNREADGVHVQKT